jgi:hypothetical protein
MTMFAEYLGLASLIAVNAGINIGIYRYFNNRLDRVYTKLDSVKDDTRRDYLLKEVYTNEHLQIVENVKGIEERIEKRFDKVEDKIEQVLWNITDLLKTEKNK